MLHPVLAHGAAGIWGQVLVGHRVGRRGVDDDRVLHGPVRAQGVDRLGDRRTLLADGHIDALNALARLVDYGIDGNRGLAGLAVADYQLPLAPPNGGH